jgi:hypothetical protein
MGASPAPTCMGRQLAAPISLARAAVNCAFTARLDEGLPSFRTAISQPYRESPRKRGG